MEPSAGPQNTAAPDVTGGKADLSADLSGQTLDDFKVLRRLGAGGMGQVYLAQQISLKRKVALKLLRADLAANSTALARFTAEAEVVAQATHANIVQVYAIGEVHGLRYMALEYVEGVNLRQYLEKKGPPELLLALSIIRQVAAALQRATELGIVHRDIKPENIMLTRKGEVKVADFGLSRIFGDDNQSLNLTQSGVSLGTPLYMSPEQVEGKPVDPRTDIYSFGVTCYHLLAGQPPFRGSSAFEVAAQHVQKQAAPLKDIRPDLPPELCNLIHRMMAKKPDDRIQTGREISREVARLRENLIGAGATSLTGAASAGTAAAIPKSGRQPVVQLGPTAPDATFDAALTQALPTFVSYRWLACVAALTVLVAACIGLGYGWWRSSDGPASPAGPQATPLAEVPAPPIPQPQQSAEEKRLIDAIKAMDSNSDWNNSLKYHMDLGIHYLKEWRLVDAEATFKELEGLDKSKPNFANNALLGKAMVLAFRNQPKESNKIFMQKLATKKQGMGKDKNAPVVPAILQRAAVAEMVAKALNYNLVNAPAEFPPALRPFLGPPVPRVREE